MSAPDLDRWLDDPVIRTRHRRTARASADALWDAAAGVRLRDARTLRRIVQWRIPGTDADACFREILAARPFTVLDEGDRWSVSGLCGRIWTTAVDYPDIDAEAFRCWDEPGTARVAFAHWTAEGPDGDSVLHSEARVEPVDRRARWALRSLWVAVGPFERLIGAEPLALATRRAEAAQRDA